MLCWRSLNWDPSASPTAQSHALSWPWQWLVSWKAGSMAAMAPEMDSNGICEYFRYRGEVLLEFDVDDVGRTTIWLNDFISYYTCFFLCVVSWSWIIWIHIIHQPVESILKKITDGRIGALDPGRGFLHHLDLTGCCLTTAGMKP